MDKKNLALIVASISLFLSAFYLLNKSNNKVAFVYIEDVMAEYNAVQDVDSKMKVKESQEKAKLDGYYMVIQEKIKNLDANKKKLKKSEIAKQNREIIALEKKHQQLNFISQNRLDSLRKISMIPVYNEVNDAIKAYAEENDYDYILGNLGNGNIMYGKDIHNVTLELIDLMNVNYNAKGD